MIPDITINELITLRNKGGHTLVDVRSPKEFKEATIPGSINIPIFSDEERAEVGTIYKRVGSEEAKIKGLAIFSAKLPIFIAAFKEINTPITVFCWRGGMRSKTAATVLNLMDIHAKRLIGGVRSYRQWVVNELGKEVFEPKLIVLNGNTGSGKTLILEKLAANGYPIIDLEGMAGHRGSIFGQIGREPSNQKKFESLLVDKLLHLKNQPFVFIEGESKRIGKVSLPTFLYDKKESSLQLFINVPIEIRVKNILEDYEPWKYPLHFKEAFQLIKKNIHTPIAKQIETDLNQGDYESATKLLLEYYYDPKYKHSSPQDTKKESYIIEAVNVEDAFLQVENQFQSLCQKN